MTSTNIFRIPDVQPVHDSDGDIDSKWVMVRADDLDDLTREHELLSAVAQAAQAADGALALQHALDELPIHLLLP